MLIELEDLLQAKLENLERLAKFIKVDIPDLRDEWAKRLVLSRSIIEKLNEEPPIG